MIFPGTVADIILNKALTSSFETRQADVGMFPTWTMSFIWTGAPVGSLVVQVSPDGETWTDLSGSSRLTSGIAGSHIVNVCGSGHMYARGKYTYSSGSGTLSVKFTGKN